MIGKTKKGFGNKIMLCILMVTALMISISLVSAADSKAGIPTPHFFSGVVLIGGTAPPQGTAVAAVVTDTGETVGSTTTFNSTGGFEMQVEYCDPDAATCTTANTTDGKARTGQVVILQVAGSNSSTIATLSDGGFSTGLGVNTSASCSDGLQNGDEDGVDCGGSCSLACYDIDVTPTSLSLTIEPNSSSTQTLTVENAGKLSLSAISLAASSLADGNITFSFAPSTAFGLASLATQSVNVTITVSNNTPESSYAGTITITDGTYGVQGANATVTVSISTSTSEERRRATRRMDLTAEGFCLGQPTIVTVMREDTSYTIYRASVDIYYGGEKILYNLLTNRSGNVVITPTKAGVYTIDVEKSNYRDASINVTVTDCGITTTTVAPPTTVEVTTTVAPPTTVEVTTTVAPPTTVEVTTTVAPPTTVEVTTTTVPPAAIPWVTLVIGLVVLVVIIVIVLGLLKKGAGGAEAAAPPAEGAK